jgi:hypothetical protein
MKLQARKSGEAASEETGPKLNLLRDRLLSQESSSEDDSTEVGAGEASPGFAPDYGTREVSQGDVTKEASTRGGLRVSTLILGGKGVSANKRLVGAGRGRASNVFGVA